VCEEIGHISVCQHIQHTRQLQQLEDRNRKLHNELRSLCVKLARAEACIENVKAVLDGRPVGSQAHAVSAVLRNYDAACAEEGNRE
jgi:hypothetical protein